jgi:hypothetical protein
MALEYIEDYIEFLFGSVDADGTPKPGYVVSPSKINLASYDRSPVASMGTYCQRVRRNQLPECLTDRQVVLARTIIGKYRRQLSECGVILPVNVDSIGLRYGMRNIVRGQGITVDHEDKKFKLRFPYNPEKIGLLNAYVNESMGKVEWNNTSKEWIFDLTEGNLRTVIDLFKDEDLKIDDTLAGVIEEILSARPDQLPHVAYVNNELVLNNCHSDVFTYLESKEIALNDLTQASKAVSYLAAMGIKIDESAMQYLTDQHSYEVATIIKNRKAVMPSSNQPDGPWHDTLLKANHALANIPWVLYLQWWSDKTDWSQFKNVDVIRPAKKGYNYINPGFVDKLNNHDLIVVIDSVVGGEYQRNYIEQKALKVIYISDITGNI